MLDRTLCCVVLTGGLAGTLAAQPTSTSPLAPRPNGLRSMEPTGHAFVGATVHTEPGSMIEGATLVIRDGRIVSVGQGEPPAGVRVHDLAGLHVYPAFIESWAEVEAPMPEPGDAGAHWNPKVTPQRSGLDGDGLGGDASGLRKLGFGAAAIVPDENIFAGTAAVVSLAERPEDESAAFTHIYRTEAFHALDFVTGSWTDRTYPNSHPGCVALMRQTLSDADWQAANEPTLSGANPMNALSPLESRDLPMFFDCALELENFLAADIAGEFERDFVLMGSGREYKWLEGIAEIGVPVITPLRFPSKPDVSTVGKANDTELERMMEWEHAPAQPARLAAKGVTMAITSHALPEGRKFHDELRSAIEHGLSEADALAALTTVPAELLGISDQLGTLEAGKRANFIVTSGPLFDEDSAIHHVWVDGVLDELKALPGTSIDGTWNAWVGPEDEPFFEMGMVVEGSTGKKAKITLTETWSPEAEAAGEDAEAHEAPARKVVIEGTRLSFLTDDEDDGTGTYIMSGALSADGLIRGTGVAPDQSTFQWTARRVADADEEETEEAEERELVEVPDLPGYPFGPYAVEQYTNDEPMLIVNATVWTQGPDGIIENGYVHVVDGKIRAVGAMPEGGKPPFPVNRRTRHVDAAGRHVTPGLIDAHSHTSLFRMGVNESGQAVTAEVRIGDSVDPSAINWYRQSAMGVTAVNSLHGSANPIGGQSQTHKVRWGVRTPAEMRMEGAKPGIKFALGENVKQSNWGDSNTTRYPQTRMGVETIIRDRFVAAKEYGDEMDLASARGLLNLSGLDPEDYLDDMNENVRKIYDRYSGTHPLPAELAGMPDGQPRRDLELEALAEVLRGDRLIHCHSYRQDEILMLCRVAEEFGFKIGTFQHGLEVYKVAEAVAEHAIGASLFSDWWQYKVEVMDAIPHAGPLQAEAGVLTSYNSDSDELVRRMNLEAAKVLKYAHRDDGTPVFTPEEALAFVTINPAIQLGIGDRVGSIEVGKDADLAVWSEDPLSVYAICERTIVDGREMFSLEQDAAHRERIRAERQRLVQKILEAPGGKDDDDDASSDGDEAEGEDAGEMIDSPPARRRASMLAGIVEDQLRRGMMADALEPGDCGCGLVHMLPSERLFEY